MGHARMGVRGWKDGDEVMKAYWLIQYADAGCDWNTTAIEVDGSRNWSSAQIIEEYEERYFSSPESMRVAPIITPKSWDLFHKTTTWGRQGK